MTKQKRAQDNLRKQNRFLSVNDVAERLSMSHWFVRGEIAAGRLSAKRFGQALRVSVCEVERYEAEAPNAY